MPRLLVLGVLLLTRVATAETTTEWARLIVDGRKVGSMSSERRVENDRITTIAHAQIAIIAHDEELKLTLDETEVTSLDGSPLSFDHETRMADQTLHTSGRQIAGDRWEVTVRKGSKVSIRKLRWPQDGLLTEGIRQLTKQKGFANGTTYAYRELNPQTLRFEKQFVTVVSPAQTGGPPTAAVIRLDSRGSPDSDRDKSSVWMTPAFVTVRRTEFLSGTAVDVIFCDEACARAPDQRFDTIATIQIPASRAIIPYETTATLRLKIARSQAPDLRLPDTSEQRVQATDEAIRIIVEPAAAASAGHAPLPADLAATPWLDIEDTKLVEFSRRSTRGAIGTRAQMLALQSASAKHLRQRFEFFGHRPASQIIRLSRFGSARFGDAALLLAALSRAVRIPTRVVVGLTYIDQGGTPANRFVPHVWVQSWIDDRWMTFDTATGGFNTSHIAFNSNVTEISELYEAVEQMKSIQVIEVEAQP